MNTEHLKTEDGVWELTSYPGDTRKINGSWVSHDHYDHVKELLGDRLKPVVVKDEFEEMAAELLMVCGIHCDHYGTLIRKVPRALRQQYERGKKDGHNELVRKLKIGGSAYGIHNAMANLITEIP